MKLIYSSDDGGSSWQRAAGVGPMNWPQVCRWGAAGEAQRALRAAAAPEACEVVRPQSWLRPAMPGALQRTPGGLAPGRCCRRAGPARAAAERRHVSAGRGQVARPPDAVLVVPHTTRQTLSLPTPPHLHPTPCRPQRPTPRHHHPDPPPPLPLLRHPQIFSCASGVYLMGTERHFSKDNNLVISKMLDDKGAPATAPARAARGRWAGCERGPARAAAWQYGRPLAAREQRRSDGAQPDHQPGKPGPRPASAALSSSPVAAAPATHQPVTCWTLPSVRALRPAAARRRQLVGAHAADQDVQRRVGQQRGRRVVRPRHQGVRGHPLHGRAAAGHQADAGGT